MGIRELRETDDRLAVSRICEESWRRASSPSLIWTASPPDSERRAWTREDGGAWCWRRTAGPGAPMKKPGPPPLGI